MPAQVGSTTGTTTFPIQPPQPPECNPAFGPTINCDPLMAQDIRNAYLGIGTVCADLDGTGQTIGIVSLSDYNLSDVAQYLSFQKRPPLRAFQLTDVNIGGPFRHNDSEAALDIEMTLAMAPNANIVVFIGDVTSGIDGVTGVSTFDDIYMNMAIDSRLTVASNSWYTGQSKNASQALSEMAARGISFFAASGDFGNIGDPQDSADLPYQTLVGGTILTVGNVEPGSGTDEPPFLYCNSLIPPDPYCYYVKENTWNLGCPGFTFQRTIPVYGDPDGNPNITGGGIMDGSTSFGCECFPQPGCCGSGVVIPGYQDKSLMTSIAQGGNGGSKNWRNYPDVSAVAENVTLYYGGLGSTSGTSAASPLWAGYAALVNQLAARNHVGQLGFANPVLYLLGSNSDNCPHCFNDIADGVFNSNTQDFPGFPSVPGYDLATGWGSPRCELLEHLSTFDPTAPQSYQALYVHIDSGDDGVNDQSSVTLDVFNAADVALLPTVTLKDENERGWDAKGGGHDKVILSTLANPFAINPFDVHHVTLTLHENGQGGLTGDNWNVAGFGVRLVGGGTGEPEACVVQLAGGDTCDAQESSCQNGKLVDGNPGVVRLSATPGGSGQGTQVSFFTDPSAVSWGGCQRWAGPPTVTTFDQLVFRLDTADDDLRSDTILSFDVLQEGTGLPLQGGTIHVQNAAPYSNHTEWIVPIQLNPPLAYADVGTIVLHFITSPTCVLCNTDEWHVEGVAVDGVSSLAPAVSTCLYHGVPGAELFDIFGLPAGLDYVVMNRSNPTMMLVKNSGCP